MALLRAVPFTVYAKVPLAPSLNVSLKVPAGVSVTFDGSNDATSNAGPTLHQRAPASAERVLDDLILYLRATLPRMRGEAPTIGGEIELVRSYLAVLQTLHGERLRVEIRGDPDVAGRPFPPMVLLPLVQGMVMDGAAFSRRTGFDAAVTTRAATAHIALVAEGGVVPEAWRGDALTGIRETLRVACGAGCAITTSSEGDRHSARIVVASPVDAGGPGRTRRAEAP